MDGRRRGIALLLALCALVSCLVCVPVAQGDGIDPVPQYQTLDELSGKTIAYVNGSVYNQMMQKKVSDTEENFYPSLADCVAAVEAGKADAAVQLSYCCQLVVNRKGGTVALVPEHIADVEEGFFFPKGSPLRDQFNEVIKRFEEDGTIDELTEKWVKGDNAGKTLPEQDWDAPNGTLKFATSGVIEPFSYVGAEGVPMGYDVDLALNIARELGYHLEVSAIAMDAIFASVSSGKVDLGGTLTNTEERARMVVFSNAVMPCYISAIVRADSASASAKRPEHTTIADLAGKNIGFQSGSILDQLLMKAHPADYNFLPYNSIGDEIGALKTNKIAAFLADEPQADLAVSKNEGIVVLPEKVGTDEYGILFPKNSPLTEQFNQEIERLRDDGTLDALKEKWLYGPDEEKVLPEGGWDAPQGTLTMLTHGQSEPLSYVVGRKEVTGYDIEVAMLICKSLGYGLDVELVSPDSIVASVTKGKGDFGAGSLSITEERQKTADFTVPIYEGGTVLVVRTIDGEDDSIVGSIKESFVRTFIEDNRWTMIASGLAVTVIISVCSGALGTLLGFACVLVRRSGNKWLNKLVDGYGALMGGIPMVVVLMVIYYVVFGSIDIAGEIVAIIAFTLAFGSTSQTTMWTAISGIERIQEETGLALGYTPSQVFAKIIYPQAAHQFMPQLAGQFVSLLKETSVVGFIAVQDLTRASDLIRARTMEAFFPLIATAIIYFLTCRLLAAVLSRMVAKLDSYNRPKRIEGVVS